MRGSLLLGILLIVLFIAGLAYYRMVVVSASQRPVYDALPQSTALFFEFRNFTNTNQILNKASFGKDIAQTGFLVKLRDEAKLLDSIMTGTNYGFSSNKTIASVHFTELHQFDYLYLIELKNAVKRDIKIALVALDDKKKAKLKERDFKGEAIFEITWPGVPKPITFAFMKGVLIASFSPFLVEESVLQIKEKSSIAKEKGFGDLLKSIGNNSDASMFIRFAKLDQIQSLLVNPEVDSLFPFLQHFSGWMAADLTIKDNAFIINGYTVTSDSTNTWLGQFKQAPVRPMGTAQVLPNNTAMYVYRLSGDLPETTASDPTVIRYLKPWSDYEMAWGILEPFDKDLKQQYFLVVAATNDEQATNSLRDLSHLTGDTAQLADYNGYKIGHLAVGKAVSNFYDSKLLTLNNPYFTILKSHVVFANTENTIKDIINHYINNQTLSKTPAYQAFKASLSDKSDVTVYIDPAKSSEMLNALLSPSLLSQIATGEQSYKKFSPMAIQFNKDGDNFFTTGLIKYQEKAELMTNQIWKIQLDTTAITGAYFLKNNNEPAILVEDAKYNVYMINKAGHVVWKRNVSAPVKGQFNSVDLYKDGQQQIVFNTTSQVWMLDQKGENVENYPIRLPANASNGMLVIDPDSSHNYQIFIACTNYTIYGYQASGKPLNGWNPQTKVGLITNQLQYVHYKNIDRIIATNIAGTVIYYNMDGKKTFDPIRLDKKFNTPFSLHQTDSSFALYNAETNGQVTTLNQAGQISVSKVDTASSQYFYYQQNGIAGGNYLFIDTSSVRIFDKQNQKVNELKVPNRIDQIPFMVNIANTGTGLGIVSTSSNKIYLFSPEMVLKEGFPLDGATAFDIASYNNDEKILVTVDRQGNMIAYRIK